MPAANTAIRSLAQWIYQTLEQPQWSVKTRQQGNTMKVLLEGNPCPSQDGVLQRLIVACLHQEFQPYLSPQQPPIYRFMIYARQLGTVQPQWQAAINLNQLEQQLAIVSGGGEGGHSQSPESTHKTNGSNGNSGNNSHGHGWVTDQTSPATPPIVIRPLEAPARDPEPPSIAPVSANGLTDHDPVPLVVSNRSLATQGNPDAIAHYLSETFSSLGIAVQVQVKGLSKPSTLAPHSPLGQIQRLQIICESPYSLEAAILAEPLSQHLRDLDLRGFRDAVVISRVQGEVEVDWVLRVDLTPPEEILRDLARWGDTTALSSLLDRHFINLQVKTEVELKEKTLHLFCKATGIPPVAPHQGDVMAVLRPLLQSLAPQGIHAAMVYGLRPHLTPTLEQAAPLWVDWLSMPAAQHPDLAASARELAEEGDLEALTFLIDRLLNPDLKVQLATGGIRIYVRRKLDLIHVMCDAPTCPRQSDVGMQVVNLVRQLRLPHIAGVRVYGRQAGQKNPLWCQGVDFIPRKRDVPEATPEFAASAQHLGDLLAVSTEALNLELGEEESDEGLSWAVAIGEARDGLRRLLLLTQLFLPEEQDPSQGLGAETHWSQSLVTIGIWGAVGILGTLLVDWSGGAVLQQRAAALAPVKSSSSLTSEQLAPEQIEARLATLPPGESLADPSLNVGVNPAPRSGKTFTEWDTPPLPFAAAQPKEAPPAALSHHFTANQTYPSFNNKLLDQKIQLLQTHLLQQGVPDVLVVGSSRALRGLDPTVLSQQLKQLGYPDLHIVNLAINGATAQVVDFQVRKLIPPEYLPQLIIWADGARAFNSGRSDITYKSIQSSVAYQQMDSGTSPALLLPVKAPEPTIVKAPPAPVRPVVPPPSQWNSLLADHLGKGSIVYGHRDQLKSWIVSIAHNLLPSLTPAETKSIDKSQRVHLDPADPEFSALADAPEGEGKIDDQGFVALSTRFTPATYYQKYARVSGDYDRDYENFHTEGDQEQALSSLLDYSHSKGVPVIFVNLPLTREYLDPIRWDYEQQFQSTLYQFQAGGKVLVRNLVDLWPDALDYFSDPSHLNRYGAESVSRHLAEDPLIPWPNKANADRLNTLANNTPLGPNPEGYSGMNPSGNTPLPSPSTANPTATDSTVDRPSFGSDALQGNP